MKKTAIQFVDDNDIVHFYKTRGLHYRTYPTDSQFVIEVVDEAGKAIAKTETKLEYDSDADIEILEERDFYYLWNLELPGFVADFLSDREVGGELRFDLNCVEDFMTEITQDHLEVVLEKGQDYCDERLK